MKCMLYLRFRGNVCMICSTYEYWVSGGELGLVTRSAPGLFYLKKHLFS